MCQTSWHIFFVTGELGDSEHQLSPLFPACAFWRCRLVRTTGSVSWSWVPDGRASLWIQVVGNCNKQESADREAGSGSITWCQRTLLLLHLGSLCPCPWAGVWVPVTAVLVMECPALGKRALGRPESLWHTVYFSVLFLFWERRIFMIVYTLFGFSLLVDITALKGAWILELGSLKFRSWPYHLVVNIFWADLLNLLGTIVCYCLFLSFSTVPAGSENVIWEQHIQLFLKWPLGGNTVTFLHSDWQRPFSLSNLLEGDYIHVTYVWFVGNIFEGDHTYIIISL